MEKFIFDTVFWEVYPTLSYVRFIYVVLWYEFCDMYYFRKIHIIDAVKGGADV